MTNISITTHPTGRSPENKYFFGKRTCFLDMSRPKYNKVGKYEDFIELKNLILDKHLETFNNDLTFYTSGFCFRVHTNDDRHAQFVRNMFNIVENPHEHFSDWTIYHNTAIESEPKIYVNLDEHVMIIVGTTFLGEIKKGVFSIVSFELPERYILPMHCAAFTYDDTTNLMFGLSGTGKTTLSSDPEYKLISDDEVLWKDSGIEMIETGCYAKSEGLTPKTHPTIFNAVEKARKFNCLVEENPSAANARLSYPIDCVENAYQTPQLFNQPNNIFFLTFDAEGILPPISKIEGKDIRLLFETGYTSTMPGTERGVTEITRTFSPCYGSPFMPRKVTEYSNLFMDLIEKNNPNVFLVNTGMNDRGERYSLSFTRNIIKLVMGKVDYFDLTVNDFTWKIPEQVEEYIINYLSDKKETERKLKEFVDMLRKNIP